MISNVCSSIQAASNVALTASNNLTQACGTGQEVMKIIAASPNLPAVANLEEFLNVVKNIEDPLILEALRNALNVERGQLLFDLALDAGPNSFEWSPQKWLEHLKMIHAEASHPLYDRLRYIHTLEDAIHRPGNLTPCAAMTMDLCLNPQAFHLQPERASELLRHSYKFVSLADGLWIQDATKLYVKDASAGLSAALVPSFPNISIRMYPNGLFSISHLPDTPPAGL